MGRIPNWPDRFLDFNFVFRIIASPASFSSIVGFEGSEQEGSDQQLLKNFPVLECWEGSGTLPILWDETQGKR